MKKDKILKYIFITAFVIFCIMLLGVQLGFLIENDIYIENIAKSLRTDNLTKIMIMITEIGGIIGVTIISSILVIIFKLLKKPKDLILVVINMLLSLASFSLIKNILQRPRPDELEQLASDIGYSFPSGHSTMNMALYSMLIILICKYVTKNKKLKKVLVVICIIMPILIGFSRIYLGMHYKTDVVAGFSLGIMTTIICVEFVDEIL